MRTTADLTQEKAVRRTLFILSVVSGLAAIIAYAVQFPADMRASVIGLAVLVAGAAGSTGGLIGFLFGIPKVIHTHREDGQEESYRPNTNLEQISDWLTKILVGIGLVQLGNVPSALARLGNSLAPAFGGLASSAVFAVGVVVYPGLSMFFFTFLWTRLRLAGAFEAAEIEARKAKEGEDQLANDARALELVDRQLQAESGTPPVAEEDLVNALKKASFFIRRDAFAQARTIRKGRNDPEAMERSIPVFSALVQIDGRNHRYHAQLGYALKDRNPPDWKQAEVAPIVADLKPVAIRARSLLAAEPLKEWRELNGVGEEQLKPS